MNFVSARSDKAWSAIELKVTTSQEIRQASQGVLSVSTLCYNFTKGSDETYYKLHKDTQEHLTRFSITLTGSARNEVRVL